MSKVAWLAPLFLGACVNVNLKDLVQDRIEESFLQGSADAREKIVLVPVQGIILDLPRQTPGTTGPERIREYLNALRKDSNVKGIILEIDSPGGSANASDTIHRMILDFKEETRLPVVALCGDMAASGGYYVACAADTIVAAPMSLCGSVGVIAYHMNVEPLLREKLAIQVETLKSGEYKDTASPFRSLEEKDRVTLQGMLDSAYARFAGVVSEARGLQGDRLKAATEGRIFMGDQAKAAGLVDSTGYLDDAVRIVQSRAGIDQAKVVRYAKFAGLGSMLRSESPLPLMETAEALRSCGPRPLYFWLASIP